MIRENPRVSLIVDNKQLTTNACGAMIQGIARTFGITRTLLSILSLGLNVAGFSKKYPGMLSFSAKGKGLPEERKLYKYRIQNQVIPVLQASIRISAALVLLLESLSGSSSGTHHSPGTSSPEKASTYSSPPASPEQPSPPRSGPSPEQQPTGPPSGSSTRTDPGPYQHWTQLGPVSPRLQDTEQELSVSSDSSYPR